MDGAAFYMGEMGMKIKCEYSTDGIGWSNGWVIGFVFDSVNGFTNGVVEHESGRLSSIPIHHIRTTLVLESQEEAVQ